MNALESVRARLSAMDPQRLDVALAALFVVAGVIELSLMDADGKSRPLTIAAAVISLSSIALRRRDPLLAAVVFMAPALAQAVLGGYFTTASTTPFVAIMLLLFSVGRYAAGVRLPAAAAVLTVLMPVTLFIESTFEFAEIFWVVFLFGLPLLAGRALRSRALLQAELREKAAAAERNRSERAWSAVEVERTRIAAELQALVANGLSAMVVQAETVPRTLDRGDFAGAAAALGAVEDTGREALTEMRRLLGVLRRDGDGGELAPQPGLARLEPLVERNRERGLAVALRIVGDRRPLSPGVDLTAYRVVEDALAAATERGADHAEIVIRYLDGELRLQVTDNRRGGASHRLPGLRERVNLYGGHLRAGRVDEGSFRLRARMPLEDAS